MKKIQKKYRELVAEDMVRIICQVAENQKALDVVALDVRELSGFADYFVIVGGTSTRHVQGLASVIDREIASKRSKPADTEGLNEGQWILLDYNDVIVHIFHHEIRAHYDLEGLWHDAPRVDLSRPVPVVEEPAVKKPKKKSAGRVIAKAAEKPVKQKAKKLAQTPEKSAKKPAARVSGRMADKSTTRPTIKSSKPASRSTGKPVGKAHKPPGKATGKATSKPTGRAVKKATTPRRRAAGGAKK